MKKGIRILFNILLVSVLLVGHISCHSTVYANGMNENSKSDESVEITSKAVILANLDSGEIIYEKNADDVLYPASITKLMTAMIVLDNCSDLSENVIISEEAYTKGLVNSTDVGMQVGQVSTVEECLKGMLIASGNECAYALAEYVGDILGGNVDTFVQAMNQKANDLGCVNTNYENPCGIHDENHYTTARDMMHIAMAAYGYPELMEILKEDAFFAISQSDTIPELYKNTHKMIDDDTYRYEKIIGGKTGYTNEAGYTLVSYASYEGKNLVCIVLGAEEDKQYIETTDLFNQEFGINEGYVSNSNETAGYEIVTIADVEDNVDSGDTTAIMQSNDETLDYIQMINLNSGEVLYSKGANEKVPAGGLTGLAAALTVLDYCSVDEVVAVSEPQNSAGSNHIRANGQTKTSEYTIGLCLYKIIYMESEECMKAVSELVKTKTGTVDYSFIKMMNKKLVEIGCTNSSFDDVFSLNEKASWTSAADMAKIFKAAYENDDLRGIIEDSNADIQTAMFSGKSSVIKYDKQGDVSLACVMLNGNYTAIYSKADTLLLSGFEYYNNGNKLENASEFNRYKKYIVVGIITFLYFTIIINISLFLNRRKMIKIPEKVGTIIANVMLATIIIGCPLYLHNKLADITMAKSYFLIVVTVIFAVLYFTIAVLRWNSDIYSNFRKYDLLLVGYLIVGLISVIMTGSIDDAVFATYGRYTGYLMDITYVLIICIAVMCGKTYKIFRYSIPVVVIPLGILAILNHYNVDPLNVYNGMEAGNLNRYISTIGNVDMFSVFMGVSFAYCGMLFCKEKDKYIQIGLVISAAIAQASVFVCSANSGYIGIVIFYLFGIIFLTDKWQILKYFLLLELFMLSGIILGFTEMILTVYMPVDSISQNILDSNFCFIGFVIIAFVVYGTSVIFMKKKDLVVNVKHMRMALIILYSIIFLCLIVGIILSNNMEIVDRNSFASLLVIGKEWGNQRGYLWKMAVDGYAELSVWQKLFGVGSSNVAHLFWTQIDPYDNQIVQMLDNAHCEYLQVLITHGILGLICLYGWIVASFMGIIRKAKSNERLCVCAVTIIAYLGTAVIGLNVPYVFVLLIVGLCYGRMEEKDIS